MVHRWGYILVLISHLLSGTKICVAMRWAWAQEREKASLKLFHNFRHPRVAKSVEKLFIKLDARPAVPKVMGVVLFYSVKYAPSDFVTAAQRIHENSSMLKHYPLRGNSLSKSAGTKPHRPCSSPKP
jgi:hypothetical protein